jgi:hypothetical protein
MRFDASLSLDHKKPFGQATTTSDLFIWKGYGGTADSRYTGTIKHDISEISRSTKSSRIRVILSYVPSGSKEEQWKTDTIYEIPFETQVTEHPKDDLLFSIRISHPNQ